MNNSSVTILFGCVFKNNAEWRSQLQSLINFPSTELGIFLQEVPLTQRKEIYTTLESSSIKNIPFVQLASDSQAWEIKYLAEKFSTQLFSLPALVSSFPIIDAWPEIEAVCVIENSPFNIKDSVFNQEVFNHTGIKGVCLDVSALEYKRIKKNEEYNKDIFVLDHHMISCVTVSSVVSSWWGKITSKPDFITSLNQLRYLAHFPQHYFRSMIILRLNNSFDEQNEVKLYLDSILNSNL